MKLKIKQIEIAVFILMMVYSVIITFKMNVIKPDGILDCLIESSLEYKDELPFDYWQTTKETKLVGTGDCEDMALLLYTKLKKRGYNPLIKIGIYDPTKGNTMHMWIELEFNNKTFILDPTMGGIFEKRNPLRYVTVPNYLFRYKLHDWRLREAE